MEQKKKYQPRICQQEFLNEGSLQPAHQSFSVLNKNLAQIVAPCAWNHPHTFYTEISLLDKSVTDHSASPQSLEGNSLWEEEAELEEQDAELNSTSLRKYYLCKKRARCEDGRRARCLWEESCCHAAEAKKHHRARRCLHGAAGTLIRRKLCSN